MNEKKLIYITLVNNYYEIREVEKNSYCCRRLTPTEVSDLLNKQQATIEAKDKEIAELKTKTLEKFEKCTDKPKQKNEDIHKWTDGRYTLMFDEHTFFVRDNKNEKQMTALQVTEKLNEQQAIIQKEKGEKINAEEKLSYMIWKYNKLKQKNFDLQVKLSEVMENGD